MLGMKSLGARKGTCEFLLYFVACLSILLSYLFRLAMHQLWTTLIDRHHKHFA